MKFPLEFFANMNGRITLQLIKNCMLEIIQNITVEIKHGLRI